MSNAPANCPRCGTALTPSAPEGLCPRCLGAFNFATETVLPGEEKLAAQPPLTPEQLAVHFPQLEIIECLGRGGMGVVYKARQKSLNRLVALKLLAPERVQDARFAERFTHEAQALAKLSHPSIVTIHDFGEAGGFYFLLMEFVDGVNLRQLLRSRKLTPEEALAIVPPLCDALQYAHERGIVHRDIKPENLLLDKDGRVKVADFGIAKMLGAPVSDPASSAVVLAEDSIEPGRRPALQSPTINTTAGTPGYMAPEQSSAPQKVDARADIYSLGVVFYEMLTGELPGAKLQPPSKKVQIDVRLDEIVLRALEQTPELRYATAAEFRTQLETFTSGTPKRETRNTEPPARFLKIGTSTFATPEQLATASGQFSHCRTRGQLILDDRQITHSRGGIIPLAAIRDVSIGRYPRMMAPMGIDVLSVTYEEGGQRKQVLLSPMEGWFGFPSTFNAHVAEWFTAIREGVIAATGRAPGQTPAAQLGVPGSHNLLVPFLFALPFAFGLFIAALAMLRPGNNTAVPGLLLGTLFGIMVIVFVILVRARRARSATGAAMKSSAWLFVPGILALVVVFSPAVLLLSRRPPPAGVSQSAVATVATVSPNRVRSVAGAPWVAQLPDGGSFELLAVRMHPSTNQPWWQPDGSPSSYDSSIEAEGKEQVRNGVMALARIHYPTNHDRWPRPAGQKYPAFMQLRDGPRFAVQNGRRLPMNTDASPRTMFGVVSFDQVLSIGNETTLLVNVATADWSTMTAQRPGLKAALFADAARKEWEFSETPGGNLKVTLSHLVERPDMEYRLVAVSVDGMEYSPTGTQRSKRAGDGFATFEASFDPLPGGLQPWSLPLRRIHEVRWEARPYQQIEFGKVSLLPGHKTLVTVKDFGAEDQKVARPVAAPARSGLAMLSPMVGEEIGTNVFRAVTTLAKERHVGVWSLEIKTDEGWSQLPGLDFWAVALGNPAPFPVMAQWNAGTRSDGTEGFELVVDSLGERFTTRPGRMDWWNEYSWRATPQDRSHWVGPGEWNLNEPNQITIFEGMKRNDPNMRATIRLNFSLFALPEDFVSALRGNYIYFGQNWRSRLGLPPDFPNPAVAVSSPQVAGPVSVAVGVSWFAILAGLIIFMLVGGGGVLLLVLLWRKLGSTAAKVLAVVCAVALLLFLLIAGLTFTWMTLRRAESNRATEAVRRAELTAQQAFERQANGMLPSRATTGRTAGIGVAVGRKAVGFVISSIIPNTPAARDGRIKAGDLVVAVEEDGQDVVQLAGMKLTDVIKMLRGEAGSAVTLHVQPVAQPTGELVRIRLVRERLGLLEAEVKGQLLTNSPTAQELVLPQVSIPTHIDFKVLRVENPPGTRNILLHFERDTNYGFAFEVSQNVMPSPDGKVPDAGHRDWQQKTWIGLNAGRVLYWTLPAEFSETEARDVARDMERKWKGARPLSDGAVPEFANVKHRDGWTYILMARVLRERGAPRPRPPGNAVLLGESVGTVPGGAVVQVEWKRAVKDVSLAPIGVPLTFKVAEGRPGKLRFRWYTYNSKNPLMAGRWFLDIHDEYTGTIFHRVEDDFGRPVKFVSPIFKPEKVQTFTLGPEKAVAAVHKIIHAEPVAPPGQPITDWWDVIMTVMPGPLLKFQPVPEFQLPSAAH